MELNITQFLDEQKLDQFMGLEHVAIDTNNFDGEVNKIKAAGIKILEERVLPDGRSVCFFEGPQGVRLEFLGMAMSKGTWSSGVVECWVFRIRTRLQYSTTPTLQYLSLPHRPFQRPIFPERFRPADVLLEVGAGSDQVDDDVLDAFVGHGGRWT